MGARAAGRMGVKYSGVIHRYGAAAGPAAWETGSAHRGVGLGRRERPGALCQKLPAPRRIIVGGDDGGPYRSRPAPLLRRRSMKLYYSPGACSLADHIALIESGLPFEAVKVDLKTKVTEVGEDYAAINPKGYVPALSLDDGEILTENVAVLSYIADRSGRLMPKDRIPHWRVLEMTAFISTELHKNYAAFFTPGASEDDKNAARAALARRYALIEASLGDRAFIVGEALSVADCYLFVMLFWAKTKVGLDVPPHLSAYYERLSQLPSIRQALADEGLG